MALNLKVGYASMMPVDSSQAPGTVLSTLRRPHNSDNDCSTYRSTRSCTLVWWWSWVCATRPNLNPDRSGIDSMNLVKFEMRPVCIGTSIWFQSSPVTMLCRPTARLSRSQVSIPTRMELSLRRPCRSRHSHARGYQNCDRRSQDWVIGPERQAFLQIAPQDTRFTSTLYLYRHLFLYTWRRRRYTEHMLDIS